MGYRGIRVGSVEAVQFCVRQRDLSVICTNIPSPSLPQKAFSWFRMLKPGDKTLMHVLHVLEGF